MATLEELETGLRKAHAAGNAEHAKRFASEIRRMRSQTQPAAVQELSMEERYRRAGIDPNEGADPTEGMSGVDKFRAGMGKAFSDTGRGLKQLGTDALRHLATDSTGLTGTSAMESLVSGEAVGSNAVTRWADRSLAGQQRAIDEERRLTQPLMDTGAGLAGNITGHVAQAAIPVGGVARAAGWGNRLLRTADASGRAAAYGAIQPVASGESRARNAGVSAAGGLLGHGVASAAGRVARGASATLDPTKVALARTAQSQGIPLHVAQMADSIPLRTAASVAKYIPFSGAGKAQQAQQGAFNRAVGRTFGADATQLSDEVMQGARRNLSSKFEDVYNRNDIPLGEGPLRKLVAVENAAAKRLTKDEAQVVRNQMDDILGELNESGVLTGQKYHAIRSQIMKAEGGDKVGTAVKDLRKALDDIAADAVGADDAATLKTIRGQWANYRTTENLLKQVAGAGGDVKPSAVWPAIRKGSTKEMRELGRIGQVLLKDPIPDSGTMGRVLTGGFMAGGGMPLGGPVGALGTLALGIPAGRALNSSAFGNYLVNGGGKSLQGLARVAGTAPMVLSGTARGANTSDKKRPKRP
jgi:hypothetical protein